MDDDKLTLQIGPAAMLPAAFRRDGECIEAWLLRLPATAAHRVAVENFKGLATAGSPPPRLQALLYHLIRELRPKMVLEIGTLFAGTAHVIARALWANGEGASSPSTLSAPSGCRISSPACRPRSAAASISIR